MSRDFYQHIFNVQQKTEAVPANEKIASWVSQLICLMYPERAACFSLSPEEIGKKFEQLKKELVDLLNATKACAEDDNAEKAEYFFQSLPSCTAYSIPILKRSCRVTLRLIRDLK